MGGNHGGIRSIALATTHKALRYNFAIHCISDGTIEPYISTCLQLTAKIFKIISVRKLMTFFAILENKLFDKIF